MTSEMAFECLFISRDPNLFRVVGGILRDLSISVEICLRASKASDILRKRRTELIVIDWEGEESLELMHEVWNEGKSKKPTLVAISSNDSPIIGAHVVIKKPLTSEMGMKSFRTAYQRMVVEYRRHVRHALMLPVTATTEDGSELSVIITDIGDGGVGLCSRKRLTVGDTLSFRLRLPGAPREILLNVRVLWTREYSRLGCEFVRIPPVDLMFLHDWLKTKGRVKKPRVEV